MAIVIPFGISDKKIRDAVDPQATRIPNRPIEPKQEDKKHD